MLRTLTLACTLLAICTAAPTAAQSWTGDYILGGAAYNQTDGVFRVDRQNTLTTIASGIAAGTSAFVWEVIMAEDNKDFYVLSQGTAGDVIVRMDSTGLIVSTVYSGTTMTNPVNLHIDQDGKLVVVDTTTSLTRLFSIDPRVGTPNLIASIGYGDAFYASACRDIDTGDHLVFVNAGLMRVDHTTGVVTTPVLHSARIARMGLAQDPLTGFAYGGTCCTDTLYEMDLVGGTATLIVGPRSLYGNYGLKFDRRVDATTNRMINANGVFSSTTLSNGISIIDTNGVITSVHQWTGGTGSPHPYSVEVEGSREVQPQLVTAPNNRQINLSFPGGAGLNYACAVNISGVRPGLRLGDGRVINFVLDNIATGSLQGALDVLIPRRVGTLNASGQAVTGLNLNVLGNAISGVSVTFQVVVLDAQAPSGIAIIAEPYAIKLD